MSKLVNWGRRVVAASLVLQGLIEMGDAAAMLFRPPVGQPLTKPLLVLVVAPFVVALYFVLAWGIWKWSGWAYWFLVVTNFGAFVLIPVLIFSGRLRELNAYKWAYVVLSVLTLIWLAMPDVYDQYWRRKQVA
jgi:hypothetical protein